MCIYCDADRTDSALYQREAHVVAECVMKNNITLAAGMQCDACNHYFGAHLEPELVRHPAVAWAIQSAAVPGKRGKPRSQVANVKRTATPTPGFFVETAPPVIRKNDAGETVVTILPLLDPNFNLQRFRRALHLVAVNALAYRFGDTARESQFDAVRSYIRRPAPREAWPFAFHYEGHGHGVDVELYKPADGAHVVRMGLYTHHFYVDLLNSGALGAWAATNVTVKTELVGPADTHPMSPKSESVPGDKRYRFRVDDPIRPPDSDDPTDTGRRAL